MEFILIATITIFFRLWRTIDSHWSNSVFKNLSHKHWLYKWANPKISWRNKYAPKFIVLRWLTIFIFTAFTDLEHFCKFIILQCIFILVWYYGYNPHYSVIEILAFYNFYYFVIYQISKLLFIRYD